NKYLMVKILRYFQAYDLERMERVSSQIADIIEEENLKNYVCQACLWDEPGQRAHEWGPYGCLYIPSDDEEETEEDLGHNCKRRCCHG
ncbi:MAG: hypothetical protein WD512_16275, partial [Candidatus Paceibacterota bacterium]